MEFLLLVFELRSGWLKLHTLVEAGILRHLGVEVVQVRVGKIFQHRAEVLFNCDQFRVVDWALQFTLENFPELSKRVGHVRQGLVEQESKVNVEPVPNQRLLRVT